MSLVNLKLTCLNVNFLNIKINFYLCVYFTMFGFLCHNVSLYFIKYKLPAIKIGYIIICSTKRDENTVIVIAINCKKHPDFRDVNI